MLKGITPFSGQAHVLTILFVSSLEHGLEALFSLECAHAELLSGTVLPYPVTQILSSPLLSSGGPFDLMSCRVVAAGTREMATLIAQALQTINYGRDADK